MPGGEQEISLIIDKRSAPSAVLVQCSMIMYKTPEKLHLLKIKIFLNKAHIHFKRRQKGVKFVTNPCFSCMFTELFSDSCFSVTHNRVKHF